MTLKRMLFLSMLSTLYVMLTLLVEPCMQSVAQNTDALFEIPVQLIGFPVILLSVRLSQFAKKLAYSLNPKTYRIRNKRNTDLLERYVDISLKEIRREFGNTSCIIEEPCSLYASFKNSNKPLNLMQMLRSFNHQIIGTNQWHLLSMFIGNAVRYIPLCDLLAKRLPCMELRTLPQELSR